MFIPRSPQFTPFATGPPVGGYLAWYDAADTSTITLSGSDVTGWADKAKIGNDLTVNGVAPTYTSRKINNITCVEFNGSTQSMKSSLTASDNTSTYFVVALQDTSAAVRSVFGSSAGNGICTYLDASRRIQLELQLSFAIFTSTLTPTNGIAFAMTNVYDTSVSNGTIATLNGVSQATTVTYTPTAALTLTLGAQTTTPTSFWDGLIGEFIMYPTALSAPDRVLVETYLRSKWGTP